LDILNKTAIDQMGILTMGSTLKQLPKDIKQIRGREVKDN